MLSQLAYYSKVYGPQVGFCFPAAPQTASHLPWMLMLSQLSYYSKVYGPQVTRMSHGSRHMSHHQDDDSCAGRDAGDCRA
jgi:hypothetical protein